MSLAQFFASTFWFPQLVCEVLKGRDWLAYCCLLNTPASVDIKCMDRWIKPLFFWFCVSLTSSLLLLQLFSSLFSEAYVISLFYITFWFLKFALIWSLCLESAVDALSSLGSSSLLLFAIYVWSLLWMHHLLLFVQSSSSLSCYSLFWLPFAVFTSVLHNKNLLQISDDPVSS